jgi:hypothetical protein
LLDERKRRSLEEWKQLTLKEKNTLK